MVELIVAPDVEVAFIAELDAKMPAYGFNGKAATSIPSPRTDEFIRVITTGGIARGLVTDRPTVAVECFAVAEGRAERFAAYARAVLEAAGRAGVMGGVTCYSVVMFSSPANLPMGSVPDRFRYTFTVSADLRMTAV